MDVIKGYTKASVIAFVLMMCSEVDTDVEEQWATLIPFQAFLDKAWLLPMHLMLNQSDTERAYMNLSLSFRGAERQAPSVLTLALQFSHVMDVKAKDGSHPPDFNTEKRLRSIISEFNHSDGMLSKWMVDEDRVKAIHNLLVGTTADARKLISGHLHYNKWSQSCFTSDLLRSTRWLLAASPAAQANTYIKTLLTVDADCQEHFLRNHIAWFNRQARRVKQSARPKLRPTVQEFERLMDYTCVMLGTAKVAAEFHAQNEAAGQKAQQGILDAFMSRQLNSI